MCVFLCEYVSVLAKAAADAQADFVLKKGAYVELEQEFSFSFFSPARSLFLFLQETDI